MRSSGRSITFSKRPPRHRASTRGPASQTPPAESCAATLPEIAPAGGASKWPAATRQGAFPSKPSQIVPSSCSKKLASRSPRAWPGIGSATGARPVVSAKKSPPLMTQSVPSRAGSTPLISRAPLAANSWHLAQPPAFEAREAGVRGEKHRAVGSLRHAGGVVRFPGMIKPRARRLRRAPRKAGAGKTQARSVGGEAAADGKGWQSRRTRVFRE